MTDVRHKIYPQMQDYDEMPAGQIVPFAMLSGPMNYKSKRINTDQHGFRYTKYKEEWISIDELSNYEEVNLIIGGSTVFGVGATGDDKTISSLLAKETGEPWFNLGIRGGVSLQEYVHLIRFVHQAHKVKNIIFFSGVNDIYINILKNKCNNFDNRFENDSSEYDCKRKLISFILSKIYFMPQSDLIDLSLKEMLLYYFMRRKVRDDTKEALSDTERENILSNNFKRNFMLYSALKKELGANVTYILQPFSEWVNKELSDSEEKVFKALTELQKGSKWNLLKRQLNKELYVRVLSLLSSLSDTFNVNFIDANPYFLVKESVFVDAVHLSDEGNKVAAELILKVLE